MSSDSERRKALFETIDQEAGDPAEQQESKVLYDALRERRSALGGEAALPADDPRLNESIRDAATRRSQELRQGSGVGSSGINAMARAAPVPVWMYAAWAAAILGGALLLYFLW